MGKKIFKNGKKRQKKNLMNSEEIRIEPGSNKEGRNGKETEIKEGDKERE